MKGRPSRGGIFKGGGKLKKVKGKFIGSGSKGKIVKSSVGKKVGSNLKKSAVSGATVKKVSKRRSGMPHRGAN